MPSLTVENYLKAILQIELATGQECVSAGQVAQALSVSPGTVTSMQKTLAEAQLADYRPYEGVRLTDAGRKVALRMVRRHRLIEQFLVQTLNLTWDQVHEEAENMEHAVSDFLVDRIDEYLGHPTHDPHGDPIPSPDGALRGSSIGRQPLSAFQTGLVRLVRVTNQDPEFLRYLSETGLSLGLVVTVAKNSTEAGIVQLAIGDHLATISYTAAQHLWVERA